MLTFECIECIYACAVVKLVDYKIRILSHRNEESLYILAKLT